tara:strand:+ start:105 stop:485 length:381 start_codon:yes stop_codon:yes gene_type:complete
MLNEIKNYLENLNLGEYIPFLDDVTYLLVIFIVLVFFIFLVIASFVGKTLKRNVDQPERKKPVLDEIIMDKSDIKINDENDFVDVLAAIEEEMNAVRELYVGGYISKGVYISETDRLYEKAKIFGL